MGINSQGLFVAFESKILSAGVRKFLSLCKEVLGLFDLFLGSWSNCDRRPVVDGSFKFHFAPPAGKDRLIDDIFDQVRGGVIRFIPEKPPFQRDVPNHGSGVFIGLRNA